MSLKIVRNNQSKYIMKERFLFYSYKLHNNEYICSYNYIDITVLCSIQLETFSNAHNSIALIYL